MYTVSAVPPYSPMNPSLINCPTLSEANYCPAASIICTQLEQLSSEKTKLHKEKVEMENQLEAEQVGDSVPAHLPNHLSLYMMFFNSKIIFIPRLNSKSTFVPRYGCITLHFSPPTHTKAPPLYHTYTHCMINPYQHSCHNPPPRHA
jgi:hypothetical protein